MAPNQKFVLMPMEASGVIGSIAGITSTETHIAFKTYRPSDIEAGFSIGD